MLNGKLANPASVKLTRRPHKRAFTLSASCFELLIIFDKSWAEISVGSKYLLILLAGDVYCAFKTAILKNGASTPSSAKACRKCPRMEHRRESTNCLWKEARSLRKPPSTPPPQKCNED